MEYAQRLAGIFGATDGDGDDNNRDVPQTPTQRATAELSTEKERLRKKLTRQERAIIDIEEEIKELVGEKAKKTAKFQLTIEKLDGEIEEQKESLKKLKQY